MCLSGWRKHLGRHHHDAHTHTHTNFFAHWNSNHGGLCFHFNIFFLANAKYVSANTIIVSVTSQLSVMWQIQNDGLRAIHYIYGTPIGECWRKLCSLAIRKKRSNCIDLTASTDVCTWNTYISFVNNGQDALLVISKFDKRKMSVRQFNDDWLNMKLCTYIFNKLNTIKKKT